MINKLFTTSTGKTVAEINKSILETEKMLQSYYDSVKYKAVIK